MTDQPLDDAAAKRERIKAISRTVHSIPVEEGGQYRPPRPRPPVPPTQGERFWKRSALAAGGVAGVALGFAAGLLASSRRDP